MVWFLPIVVGPTLPQAGSRTQSFCWPGRWAGAPASQLDDSTLMLVTVEMTEEGQNKTRCDQPPTPTPSSSLGLM